MQRIIINETDLTSNVEVLSSYDVAYVPGFMTVNDDNVSAYFRKPTLFTNAYEFSARIGGAAGGGVATPPTFASDQPYPVFSATTEGFTSRAIPPSGRMFAAGDIDLGYRIAHYLLSLGIPVYYEVMNNTNAGTLTSLYNYTLVNRNTSVFIPNVNYYVYIGSGDSPSDSVSVIATNNLTTSAITVNTSTFATAFGSHTGTFTFTATSTADDTPTLSTWSLDPDIATEGSTAKTTAQLATDFGITVTMPQSLTAETIYSFTVFYDKASDGVISDTVAPGTTGARFRLATTTVDGVEVPISSFADGTNYYTMEQVDSCPISVESMYAGLKNRFIRQPNVSDSSFDSMSDYSIKYITSGGYPVFEYSTASTDGIATMPLMTAMISMAATRRDAIALIDHTNNPYRELYPSTLGGSGDSVIDIVRTQCINMDDLDYAAMFTPWYSCSHQSIVMDGALSSFVPASVGYLSALAVQIRDYNPWLAVSGVVRGRVPNLVTDSTEALHVVSKLTNNIADSYQTIPTDVGITQLSINPITYIRNVGYCIWGNRTLRNNSGGTSALSFLNIRGVVNDVKKVIFEASQSALFEQNTDVTWINFKTAVTPLLDRMTSNYVLQDYGITRYLIDPETGEPVPAYKVLAVIRIQPINSIEVFELAVQIENTDVIVSEM